MDTNIVLWPGWETVGMIGRGSFGSVYKIQRDVLGNIEEAALKVISIPQNDSDIDEMYSDGYDEESVTSAFHAHLKSIVAEYSLMRKMNGSSNIVNCDDVRYVQHQDGVGWDIYIKMELLTPLVKALPATVSEKQVINIAKDMCAALELCQKHSIIHRDVKPQNIFVSENGDYKLGDFGIAKTMEKTMGGTKTGTYKYMAPEVYSNKPYNSTADIYSLGLVLYWLLNERRMPFVPRPPEKLRAGMDEESRIRRLSGEQIPAPKNGSNALKKIVLKACAFDPKNRYRSAHEMREDLEYLSDDNFSELASKPLPAPNLDIHAEPGDHTIGSVIENASFDDLDRKTTGPVFRFGPSKDAGNLGDNVGSQFLLKNRRDKGCVEREQKLKPETVIAIIVTMISVLCGIVFFTKDESDSSTNDSILSSYTSAIEEDIPAKQPPEKIGEEHEGTATLPSEEDSEELKVVDTQPPKTPSEEDLIPFGNIIAYPKAYLSSYETKCVRAPKGYSIYVFWNADGPLATSKRPFYLYEGDVVTVLAREKTRSCVIFTDINGEKQVGWVSTNYLVD